MGQPLKTSKEPLPVHPLDGAEKATFVYKSRPLSDLPWLGRLLVWFLHKRYGWSAGEGYEGQGIYTDWDEAGKVIAARNGWKRHEYKINESLPDEPCQYGRLDASPASVDREKYSHRKLKMVAVEQGNLSEVGAGLRALYSHVKALNRDG